MLNHIITIVHFIKKTRTGERCPPVHPSLATGCLTFPQRGRGMAQSVLVSRLSQLIVTLSWPLHYKLVMAGGRAYALGMNPYFLVLGA